jgi:hypothetical protein
LEGAAVWAFYANGWSALFGFARLERRIAFQAREPPFEGLSGAKAYCSTLNIRKDAALGEEGPHKRSALGGEHRIVRKH